MPGGKRGDTLLFVRRGAVSASSGSTIPSGGAVLAAYGSGLRTQEVQAMADGDTVKILLTTLPRVPRGRAPAMIVGGWPRILRDGENIAGDAATLEGTLSRNAESRHPRTAIGFSRDSSTLLLLTVDGRSENSGGMTLVVRTQRDPIEVSRAIRAELDTIDKDQPIQDVGTMTQLVAASVGLCVPAADAQCAQSYP